MYRPRVGCATRRPCRSKTSLFTIRFSLFTSVSAVVSSPSIPSPDAGSICVGEATEVTVGAHSASSMIEVEDVGIPVTATLGQGETTFIPDGPNCDTRCYESSVTFYDFDESSTIENADNINYVRIKMEHSFIGDVQIKLTCPTGQSAIILPDYYSNAIGANHYKEGAIDPATYDWPGSLTITDIYVLYNNPNILAWSGFAYTTLDDAEQNSVWGASEPYYYMPSFSTEADANWFIENNLGSGVHALLHDGYYLIVFDDDPDYVLLLKITTYDGNNYPLFFSSASAGNYFVSNVVSYLYSSYSSAFLQTRTSYGNVFFGEPDIYDLRESASSVCDVSDVHNLHGVGYDYAWTSSSHYTTVGKVYNPANIADPSSCYINGTTSSRTYPHVIPSVLSGDDVRIYEPEESFSNLIGCPMNGTWSISVCDSWEADNGYIFDWDLSLNGIVPNTWSYDVHLAGSSLGNCPGKGDDDTYLIYNENGSPNFYIHPTNNNAQYYTIGTQQSCSIVLNDDFGCESPGTTFTYTVVNPVAPSISASPICIGEEINISAALGGNVTEGGRSRFLWWRSFGENGAKEQLGGTISGVTSATLNGIFPTTSDSIYWAEIYDHNGCGGEIRQAITINDPDDGTGEYDYIWRGGTVGNLTNWNTPTNWYILTNDGGVNRWVLASGVPDQEKNVYIGTPYCKINDTPRLSNNASAHNLTIGTGATVTVPSGKTLNIAGDLDNTGRLTATSGTVNFCGPVSPASDQTITHDVTLGNVVFNNRGGNIVPSGSMGITGTATFTKGVVEGDVTFGNSASVANAETMTYNSYVDGVVTKTGSANGFTFPTGNNGVLGKVKATSDVSGVTVRYLNNPAGFGLDVYPRWWNVADMCSENNPQLDHVSNFEYWDIATSGRLNAKLTVSSADGTAHFNAVSPTHNGGDVYGAFWNGNCWENIGGVDHSVSDNPYGTISVGVTIPPTRAYSKIVSLGSQNRSTVLPIELTSFAATCDGMSARVVWTTATERNNDVFVLERSDDAVNFTEIARVAGAGNSIEPLDYSYTDYGVHGGDNYYRLVQVDYDGTRSVSDIVVAICEDAEVGEPDVQAYPNPFDDELIIELDNFDNRPASIEVFDMLGKLIVFEKVDAPQNSYEIIMNLSNLPPTAYNIRVSTADFVINKQVIKN